MLRFRSAALGSALLLFACPPTQMMTGNCTFCACCTVSLGSFSVASDAEEFDTHGQIDRPAEVGEEAFIGSDTMLVAPVKIGRKSKTGAGAVVTHDVPDETTVVGVPARPLVKKA